MKNIRHLMLGAALSLMTAITMAQPVELSGIKFDSPIELRGTKLELNGAGIRYKVVVKVYAAGLYLTKKASTLEEVLAAPGPKRMAITVLRDVDSAELGKLFTRGVEDNTPRSEMSKLVPGLIRMGQIFSDHKKLLTGENFLIEWIPGTGTVITIKGKAQEPFKEPEFFGALMRIWLGPNPGDWKLKDALLGNK
jgi:hypothetical protein